ncbi:hypothetical protein AB0O00_40190, partial [Kitasatospora sp. NPDC093558]
MRHPRTTPARRRMLAALASVALVLAGAAWTATPATAATGITNGDFEAGNLTGWTATGTASVTTSGPHGGSYAAMLGSTSPTNGLSSISQSFTAPSGSPALSFWYEVTCPDTVTYDWATATLQDTTAGTTSTVLPKTCTSGAGWQQITSSLTAGHAYTLTLSNQDDNWPGDATYTLYDDVQVTGAATDDFSLADSLASATVNAGAAATSTVSTAVTAGSAQTVALSASGLPSGVTAAFSPSSVTAGGSSTLTVSTAASTPSGTYPITVTGTGTSATHTATFTLTVNGTGPNLVQVSTDPFTNSTSQHATELEPDTFAYGTTIVSSSQVGRFTDGGSSDISWNTSTDGGTTWQHGMLPGITTYQGGGSWARVSDPSVAYDARHGTWMITGLVIDANVNGAGVSV